MKKITLSDTEAEFLRDHLSSYEKVLESALRPDSPMHMVIGVSEESRDQSARVSDILRRLRAK